MEKLILLDANSLLYRAFFAIQNLATSYGQPTNALFGFTKMLFHLLDKEKPNYIVACYDTPEETFRHKSYKEYKANRPPMPDKLQSQFALSKELLEAFNIKYLECPGYEAEDVIATIAENIKDENIKSIIVTGDLDTLQLIDENTMVLSTSRGITDTVLYDVEKVKQRFDGLAPGQLIDLKALTGDTSDNIPAIQGIGEKGAIKLIKEFHSTDNLLNNIEKVDERYRKILQENIEQIKLNKYLVEIITDAPIEINITELKWHQIDKQKTIELFERLEFKSFLKKLEEDEKRTKVRQLKLL